MDFNGLPVEGKNIDEGGTINGNLGINGTLNANDGNFINVNVSDTLTADTIVSNIELEVKDPLITCAVDNPGDGYNTGLLNQYNNGAADRWAGLVRSKDDKSYYLLKDEFIKPTPTTNLTILPLGVLSNMKLNEITGNVCRADNVLYTKNGVIFNNTVDPIWKINATPGTNGQVLSYLNGETVWIAPGGGGGTSTLQEAYDLSTAPQISTTVLNQKFLIKQGTAGLGSDLLELQNSAGAKRVSFDTTGKMDISGSNASVQFNTNTNVKKWTLRNAGGSDRFEINDDTDINQLSITQDGTVNVNNIDIGMSPGNTQIDDMGLILNEKIHTKEVSIRDATGIRRYDIKVDGGIANNFIITGAAGGDLLQETLTNGTHRNYVNNIKKFEVNATGADIIGELKTDTINELTTNNGVNIENVLLLDGLIDGVNISPFKNDYDSKINQAVTTTSDVIFNTIDTERINTNQTVIQNTSDVDQWIIRTEGANNNLEIVNNSLDQTIKMLQSGETTFKVDNNLITSVNQTGINISDNLKSSSFKHEIRDIVPVLPASLTWNARQEHVGIITLYAADTLCEFVSSVEQRSLITNEYVILNKIDINGIVSLEINLTSVVENDIFIGVQFTNESENYTGSLVGLSESQYYLLITKNGDISKIYQEGKEYADAIPNINVTNGVYIINIRRTGYDTWELFFEQGTTTVSSTIFLTGTQWGSRHAYFMIGDKSNVLSSFNMTIQTCSSIGYNTSAGQNLYEINQAKNNVVVSDQDAEELINISKNRVEIKQHITCKSMNCDGIQINENHIIKTPAISYKGMIPNATQLKTGLWDDSLNLVNTTIVDNLVTFPLQNLKRSVASKYFFIPNDISIGGFCEFSLQIVSYDAFVTLGLLFKDASNVFYGTDTFNSVNHWYAIFDDPGTANINLYYIAGQFVGYLNSQTINPLNSTIKTRITRTAADTWSIQYGKGALYTNEPITFGPELSNKFVYLTCGMNRGISGTNVYRATDFIYNLWNPSTNDYTIKQNADNDFVFIDNSNTNLLRMNPNICQIYQTMITERSLNINRSIFPAGAQVGATFYQAIIGPNITGLSHINFHTGITTFGNINIPQLSMGNIIKYKLSGLIKTGSANQYLDIQIWAGIPNAVGSVLIGQSDRDTEIAKDLLNRYFEMTINVVPSAINFTNGTVEVKTYGSYSYNNKFNTADSLQGNTIQNPEIIPFTNPRTWYQFTAFPNDKREVYVIGAWDTADVNCVLTILNYSISYDGFNL